VTFAGQRACLSFPFLRTSNTHLAAGQVPHTAPIDLLTLPLLLTQPGPSTSTLDPPTHRSSYPTRDQHTFASLESSFASRPPVYGRYCLITQRTIASNPPTFRLTTT
jgi:hypothetical protein